MKTNNRKILQLINHGFSGSLLSDLNEGQINALHSRLSEQVTTVNEPAKTVYNVGDKGGSLPAAPKGYSMKKNSDGTFMAMPNEQDDTLDVVQDPDATEDGMGMFEEKEIDEKFESKKQQKYFFAKCGDGKTKEQKKWCKMAEEFGKKTNFAKLPEKKKETKENYQEMISGALNKIAQAKLGEIKPTVTMVGESENEKHIMRLVEKHITPKMSKKDFENILEGDTKTAPAKPKEREKEKKPGHPFKPDPDKKGAPKAKKRVMDEDTKTAPAKPKVSPGTKPKHPFQPDPDKQGAPKAIKRELPSFLTFNALGLNKK